MSFLNTFTTHFLNTMEKRAALRAWYHLQSVDTRSIEHAGLSAELLAQGPSAYPWRATADVVSAKVTNIAYNKKQLREAAAELRACSDAELRDLGIARNSIDHVVRYGRDDVDQQVGQERRAA